MSTGVTGFGSSIIIQAVWRLSQNLFGLDLGEEKESARTVLALTTITGFGQAVIGGIAAYRAKHYRRDIIAYLYPGSILVTFVGNFAAVTLQQDVLTKTLGCTLIMVAIWQFTNQNILAKRRELASLRVQEMGVAQKPNQQTATLSSAEGGLDVEAGDADSKDNQTIQNGSINGYSSNDADLFSDSANASAENETLGVADFGDSDGTVNSSSSRSAVHGDSAAGGAGGAHNEYGARPEFLWASPSTWWPVIVDRVKNDKKVAIGGLIAGCLSGFTAGAFGIGGPPVMIYFALLELEGTIIRDTYMLVCTLSLPFLVGARLYFGVFQLGDWFLYLISTIMVLLGLKLGYIIHPKVNTAVILVFLQGFVLLSSIPLTKPLEGGGFGYFIFIVYIACFAFILIAVCWRRNTQQKIDALRASCDGPADTAASADTTTRPEEGHKDETLDALDVYTAPASVEYEEQHSARNHGVSHRRRPDATLSQDDKRRHELLEKDSQLPASPTELQLQQVAIRAKTAS